MSWVRQPDGKFSEKQREKIISMVEVEGKTQIEVARIVGCDSSAISLMIKMAKARKKAKAEKKAKRRVKGKKPAQKKSAKAKPAQSDGEKAYLLWALRGALSRVKGVSFVDRLIMDVANDRLTELG